ncbi:methyltransferase domain-containing protein [Thermaurantiacus sp.]
MGRAPRLSAFERGLSAYFRRRRDAGLRAMIVRLAKTKGSGPFRILDLGGRFDYWERVGLDFLEEQDVTVLCVNHSVEEMNANRFVSPRLSATVGNACDMRDHADGSFDLVHSNSVIEHVGRFADMLAFARETRRLAPAYYVQTPYAGFPIDPHWPRMPFFHWLPWWWRAKILRRFKIGWGRPTGDIAHAMRDLESAVLLDRSQFRYLFPDARHRFEWFLFLPKSMIAERG